MSFIVLDGPDGSGKSTQIKLLAGYLEKQGKEVLCIREPGQTALGEQLRDILLNAEYNISARSEVFLFNAARSQMIAEVVEPALNEGKWILCDRFYPSTLVYQSYAGGEDLEVVKSICKAAVGSCEPSHVFMLDVSVKVTQERLGETRDRIESKGEEYLKKVRDGFVSLAKANSWPVISATQPIEAVHAEIVKGLSLG